MKRPEGFDPPARQQLPADRKPTARQPAKPAAAQKTSSPPPRARVGSASRSPRPDAAARAELRAAARERRRFERSEVRRFTRRARNRRLTAAAIAGVTLTMVALVFAAVFSPILALRTIRVDGTTRVDAASVMTAVESQLGTPLALIDYSRITDQLTAFPLIRSYVTEIVPPDTLLIHVVERQPVGTIVADGTFRLVDPAGIVIQESPDRVPGVPLIDLAGTTTDGPGFASMVEVLLSLPPSLLAQVDTISATTQDNVSLLLAGVGQRVTWGSADNSAQKATLLAALIAATDPSQAGEFDVSAPSNGVFRPA